MIHGIFAVDRLGGMGFNGTLPWPHIAEDLANFQSVTAGHVVVMGRRTWDDPKMPKPLPGRINYVLTNRAVPVPTVRTIRGDVVERLRELEQVHTGRDIFVIGGKDIIESAGILFDTVHLTRVNGIYRTDTRIHLDRFLLGFQATTAWPSTDRSCTFMIYKNRFRA